MGWLGRDPFLAAFPTEVTMESAEFFAIWLLLADIFWWIRK